MVPARLVRSMLPLAALLPFSLTGCGIEGAGDASSSSGVGSDGSLGTPNAVFPEDFGSVQTVRELADGTVLVADPLGGALYHVDMDAGTRSQIGSEGQGPGEYRQPDAVWPLPGDSTMVVDLGNARLMTLGPTLAFGATSPLSGGDPRSGMVLALPQAVDDAGFVYSQSIGMGGGPPPDSGAVLRIERGSLAVDSLTSYKLEETRRTESGGPGERNVSVSAVPLSPEDTWGVAPDGSVVVARSLDYHVEWFAPDGSMTAGPPVDFDAVSIGTAEKEEFVRARGQGGGGISISVSMTDGGAVETSFQRGGRGGNTREIDQYEWPDTKPPFYDHRIVVDSRDRAWVRRHVEAGADATYDLFDRSGTRVMTYTLGNNKRVIGFGAESVYVVAFDDFDLNYLERYALPGT